MPGIAVFVKNNPSIGTTTDLNGKYLLDVPNEQAVLVYQMLGFDPREIPVGNKTIIYVGIKASSKMLNEAVVVAFGP